jgi:hypothetical protein
MSQHAVNNYSKLPRNVKNSETHNHVVYFQKYIKTFSSDSLIRIQLSLNLQR